MKTIRISTVAVLALAFAFAGQSHAQDISATPTYGTQNLSAGFMPDPVEITLAAGGANQVTLSEAGCAGYINNAAPDVDLNYESGPLPLNIYVKSDADTTLVINLPDGSWVCNDDANGLNPHVAIESPATGLYNIWVGNYDGTETPSAKLYISEMDPQW